MIWVWEGFKNPNQESSLLRGQIIKLTKKGTPLFFNKLEFKLISDWSDLTIYPLKVVMHMCMEWLSAWSAWSVFHLIRNTAVRKIFQISADIAATFVKASNGLQFASMKWVSSSLIFESPTLAKVIRWWLNLIFFACDVFSWRHWKTWKVWQKPESELHKSFRQHFRLGRCRRRNRCKCR